MEDDERLREALMELETLRVRDAARLQETRALLTALEALTASASVDEGLDVLLRSIRDSLACDGVVLFETEGDVLRVSLPSSQADRFDWTAPGLLTRPRRIVDLHRTKGLWDAPPEEVSDWRSLLTVPIIADGSIMVLVAHADTPGFFRPSSADLLGRLAAIVGQGLLRQALERRNSFLARVIDESPASVAIAVAKGHRPLIYVNGAFETLTGYTREDVMGENCRMLTAESPDSPVRSALREAIAEGRTGSFVLRNRRKDGEEFWNELQIFPLADETGTETHIIATQSDVTARVNAERERDLAQNRLEGALAATSEGFLILGRRGVVRFVNDGFAAMIGRDRVTMNHSLADDVAAELLDMPRADLPEPVIGAFATPHGRDFKALDGRQFLLRSRPIDGGGAVVTASDITQLKVNERALRRRFAAIERSQDGIAIGDADGRIIEANPSLLRLWGRPTEDAVRGRLWTSFYGDDLLDALEVGREALRRRGSIRLEASFDTGDARRRTHEISLSVEADVGSILVVRDITDRLQDAAERDDMRRRLDRAQMQEHLAMISAGLTHDFNNLLSAILGSAALLESDTGLSASSEAAVTRIQSAASRAAELVDGLLDISAREKTAERIDLGRLLANTVDMARGSASQQVRFTVAKPEAPVLVTASQTDILQVAMNLVVNAVGAIGEMPGEVRVGLRGPLFPDPTTRFATGTPRPGARYAAIDVEDTGSGMSEELIAKVLEPYFTTKGNLGTGLGLAIVVSVLGDAGGLLEIDSTPGRGTRMTAWWPLDPETDAPKPVRSPVERRTHLPVLVLDDATEVANSHAAALSAAGLEVAATDDAEAALEILAEDPEGWGCLVTDYDMPGLTGGDVIARLERLAPDLPVIVVSALARRLTDTRLYRASNLLQKPLQGDTLVEAVRRAMGEDGNETSAG